MAGTQYRTGRRAYSLVVLLTFALAGALLVPGTVDGGRSWRPPVLPPALRGLSLEARLTPRADKPPDLRLRLSGATSGYAYVLSAATARVTTRNGEQIREVPTWDLTPLVEYYPPAKGVRWAGVRTGGYARWEEGWGIGRVRLDSIRGFIEAWQGRLIATLPLKVGAVVARSGRRVQVETISEGEKGLQLELAVSSVGDAVKGVYPGRIDYALLDRGRSVIFPMRQLANPGGSSSLFLPTEERTLLLEPRTVEGDPPPPRLGDSLELVLFEWKVVGSTHVSVPVEADTATVAGGR